MKYLILVLVFLMSMNVLAVDVGGSKTEPPKSNSTIYQLLINLLGVDDTKK